MDQRLAAADAALKAGRAAEAVDHLKALVADDPAQPLQVYRVLTGQLYRLGRYEEGEAASAAAVQRHKRDPELWNARGVLLRKLKRYPDSLKALDEAIKLAPNNESPLANRLNVLLDMGDGPRAEAVALKLVRKSPRNSEHQRQLGRALRLQGKMDAALARFRQAAQLNPASQEAWVDLTGTLGDLSRFDEALATAEKALEAIPDHPRLVEAKAIILRFCGQPSAAAAFLKSYLPRFDNEAWLHRQLGGVLADVDRAQANQHLRRAVELAPDDVGYRLVLIESLERTRTGDEGANIEEAYRLLEPVLQTDAASLTPSQTKIAFEVLTRVSAFDQFAKLGDVWALGRSWAENRQHTALLKLLAHVRTPQDRKELLAEHRLWGQQVEKIAAERPVRRPPPRPAGGKIRLGLMSSDLRRHPVGYFALPLFDHIDDRFELYCYSFYANEHADPMQQYFAGKATAFRWRREIAPADAAQMIADDQLDFLIELGGSTYMNKLEVMAWKPAPRQASWLGYPHSAGLATIDYLICDPYTAPPRPDLLVEKPLLMPKTWIGLGRQIFSEEHVIEPGLPQDRAGGRITFGTANNPHKYNPDMIALWSEVLRAVPGSRFLFVRPEGGTESFRRNIAAEFGRNGVEAERIEFRTIRGAHMPFYNEIDITLDCVPLTGGTTTTEALWMGVPVVSLIGEAFFERLSSSILANSGVPELATPDRARYVEIAVELAGDRARRAALRTGLRDQMRDGPLGRTEEFAGDFYELIARTVQAG